MDDSEEFTGKGQASVDRSGRLVFEVEYPEFEPGERGSRQPWHGPMVLPVKSNESGNNSSRMIGGKILEVVGKMVIFHNGKKNIFTS